MKKYNINIFVATDLLINGSIPFLNKFCDIIIKKNLHPFWSGQASIRKEMAPALLVKMRMAGCFLLTYGVESFSDKIRKGMRKGELVSTVENVIKDTKKAGIAVRINLIVGFPREDESDVDKTISALKRLARYIDNIGCLNVCHVFPNTPLYDEYNHFGIPKESRSAGYLFVGKNTNFRLRIKRFRKIYYECKKLNLEPLLTNASDFLDTKL